LVFGKDGSVDASFVVKSGTIISLRIEKVSNLQEAEEKVHGFGHTPGDHDADADRSKFDLLPQMIRDQSSFADSVPVMHPQYENWY
jgi:hypothetical protein